MRTARFLIAASLVLTVTQPAFAHCQIPCGIYNDDLRVAMLDEHITTIEKSMTLIRELSADPGKNANQLVRWIQNKEDHATAFREIVTEYFLTQRIAPVEGGDAEAQAAYVKKLTLLHEMLVYSMKAKQTTDQANVDKLRDLLAQFRVAYFGPDAADKQQGSDHKH